jgi:peptidoglycan/LPS O-acetylase OafA/YrhL
MRAFFMPMPPVKHLPGLDLLRALAIVWVMCFHAFLVGGLGPDWEWLSRFGWAGVDIFFVLSGFLIGGQVFSEWRARGDVSLRDFYWRRAWRILPAFTVVLAVYALWPAAREVPGLQPWWQFASFTVNLLIDYGRNQAFSHAWSLCVEEHFYWFFPLAVLGLAPFATARRVAFGFALLVAAGIALRAGVWLHDAALAPDRAWFIEDLYYPTWMRLDGLLVGVALAALRVFRPLRWARWQALSGRVLVAGLLLAALALALFRERTGLLANSVGWPLLSLAFGALLLAASRWRWRLPGAAWLAALSYSLYLSHKLAFHAVQTQLLPLLGWTGAAQFPVYAAATLLLGAALHYGIERPGLRWRDRLQPSGRPRSIHAESTP